MIANDPRRSWVFFQNPVEAGREARGAPLDLFQILSLHAIRAIVLAVSAYYAFSNFTLMNVSSAEQDFPEGYQRMIAAMNQIYSSPLILTLIGFISGLIMTSLFWQIGRAMAGNEITWFEAQSGMMRYLIITAIVSALIGWLSSLSASGLLSFVNFSLTIYFLINFVQVLRGVMELSSFGQAFLVIFLGMLAMAGLSYLLALLMTFGAAV